MTDRLKMLMIAGMAFSLGAVSIALLTAGLGMRMPPTLGQTPGTTATGLSYADAVARAAPAVMRVFGQQRGSTGGSLGGGSLGSGGPGRTPDAQPDTAGPPGLSRGSAVLVSDDGLLVTSGHLVAAADAIGVQVPDRRILTAELLGIDAPTDLAVLRLHEPVGPAIALGEPEALRPGDVVLAIGNPFGLDQTASLGIVSALGRSDLGLTQIEGFIQTDAAINPGNSGGALIDTRGRLVGINTAIMSDSGYSEGVAFAIPADRVMQVVAAIAATGKVARGWIGIGARTLDTALVERFGVRAPRGAFITRVLPNSPAAAAGLRAGDVIVSAGGGTIDSAEALRRAVDTAATGGELQLSLWRGSERLTTRVRTQQPPHLPAGDGAGRVATRGCPTANSEGC